MPRKIGYGNFTPARRAALRKAQLESARKRRRNKHEDIRKKRRKKILLGAAAVGALAAAGGAAYVGKQKLDERAQQKQDDLDLIRAENRKNFDDKINLKKAAGNVTGPAQSQEEFDARVKLYGASNVLGEYSSLHEGRAEIFPTLPVPEIMRVFTNEAFNPSYSLLDENPNDEYVTLYHRTGGGKDLNGKAAKESILANQSMEIRNRDEKRAAAKNPDPMVSATVNNKLTWWSNKLNDSNTRAAFGEDVVQIKVKKSRLKTPVVGIQSFGELSPIQESWVALPPDIIEAVKTFDGAVIEDVSPDQIQPAPERKWRVQ